MDEDKYLEGDNPKFTWVQTHKGLVQYLTSKEGDQEGLIQLLKSVGATMFNDRDDSGNVFELEEIDPFTFFCYIYKYGDKKRLEILQAIANKLNLTVPKDTAGLPSANAQKVWLFPYKKDRKDDDIGKLWALFKSLFDDKITDSQFADALAIQSTGKTKLTEAFFYVKPEKYFPINGPSIPFLKKQLNIDPSFKSFSDYERILERIKETSPMPLYELSYKAWEWNKGQKEGPQSNPKRYWLYSPGENAEHWEEFYREGIMGLGWDYLGDLGKYSSKNEIIQKLQKYENVTTSKKNDATANFQFKETLSIGDIVIVKNGRRELLGYGEVNSDYFYDSKRKTYQKCRKVKWIKKGSWQTDFQLALKTLTDITRYPTDDSRYNRYYERLLGIINGDQTTKPKQQMRPLNTILFGPPGTGKTFKLQNEYFDKFTVSETTLSRKQYLENLISELTWWQVITVVMIDLKSAKINEIYEHELIKIKEGLSNSQSIKQTLWGQLQVHTKTECENVRYQGRSEPLYFWKDNNSVWTIDTELVNDLFPEAFKLLDDSKKYSASPDKKIRNYEFVTFHQSFSYEDFVEGIKPRMEEQDTDLSYEIKDGIFKKICLRATADPQNQYAIFIDEINRGNVSSIFGELITLVEDDKRIGGENPLTVKLPYSKTEFGIPSNLHVIGTMNTADRSIEALDTALRRRFIFEEILPLPHLLKDISFLGFNLEEVLETINKRIEALLDRDHCIGHSYFIKVAPADTKALSQTFQNKIIPLLQEYFYHDYEKIALILGEGFVERNEGKVKFASFQQIEEPEIVPSFELKKNIEDIETAVRKLLNRKDEVQE